MKTTHFFIYPLVIAFAISKSEAQISFQKRESVNFSQIKITDKFWNSRINAVTNVSIPVCIDQTEVKTGRIRNFEKVAAKKGEKHEGIYYED